jgi:hypothetical protein
MSGHGKREAAARANAIAWCDGVIDDVRGEGRDARRVWDARLPRDNRVTASAAFTVRAADGPIASRARLECLAPDLEAVVGTAPRAAAKRVLDRLGIWQQFGRLRNPA